jgi:hypothetical protein
MTLAKLAALVLAAIFQIFALSPAAADSGAVQLLQPSLPDTGPRQRLSRCP